LSYRVTPHAVTGVSPAELLLKYRPKTLLDLIKPDPSARDRQQQELRVECGTRQAREFRGEQQVWVQTFVRPVGPLSYDVEVGDRKMKRHIEHLISADVVPFPERTSEVAKPVQTPGSSPKTEQKTPPATSPEFRSAASSPVARQSPEQNVVVPVPFILEEDSSLDMSGSSRPTRNRRKPERLHCNSFN